MEMNASSADVVGVLGLCRLAEPLIVEYMSQPGILLARLAQARKGEVQAAQHGLQLLEG